MMNQRMLRLLALILALLLAMPCLAMAEDEIVESEYVDAPIADEGEIDLTELQEEGGEASAEDGAQAGAAYAVEAPAEDADEAPVAENPEAPAVEVMEAPAVEIMEASAEEVAQAPAEVIAEVPAAEVAEASAGEAIADGGDAVGDAPLMAAAGSGPVSVAIDVSQGLDFYLGMGSIPLNAILDPVGAQTTLKWKSSKKKVVKVDQNGVITPRKAGTAKITVTTGNKKKASVKVKIHKNKTGVLVAKPSRATVRSIGNNWTLAGPKSVERTANGSYVVKVYVLNNVGRSRRINNLGLQLYIGDVLIAQKTWSRVKCVSKKGTAKVLKLTFSPADLVNANPLLLTLYGADSIKVYRTTDPSIVYTR